MYDPPPVTAPVPPSVLTLLAAAKEDNLVLCVGAGLSVAEDACLPSGRKVGTLLDARLTGRMEGYTSPDDVENLIAVADAAVVPAGGETALRQEVLAVADFTRATPNHGHQAMGLLLAEGAITALSWNWDTCIERSGPADEQLRVARTETDMASLQVPQLSKVHGCAEMPASLLVTTEHLNEPPIWTEAAMTEHIRASTLVFVGIGDVADYARRRIKQLVEEFSPPDAYVVSPSIRDGWEDSVWAEVLPELPEERRIAELADAFLDQLARCWAGELLEQLKTDADAVKDEVKAGVQHMLDALGSLSSLALIRWCRQVVIRPKSGTSAVFFPGVGDAVLAASALAATREAGIAAPRPGCCTIGDDPIELVACENRTPSQEVHREARRRAERLAENGVPTGDKPVFLVAGTVLGRLEEPPDATHDVVGGTDDLSDVVDGPAAVSPRYIEAAPLVADAA